MKVIFEFDLSNNEADKELLEELDELISKASKKLKKASPGVE